MLQKRLRGQVHLEGCNTRIRSLAAADVAYSRGEDWAWAGAVLFRYPELEPLEEEYVRFRVSFPYVPGLLSFREGPGLFKVLSRLGGESDLILFDGQGRAHPQGVGLASHLGVLLRTPTIGCAKGRFVGDFEESDLGIAKGSWVPLTHQGDWIGAAVRTRTGVKPIFVSPGHLIDLRKSIEIVLACCRGFRLPEPMRRVHLRVRLLASGISKLTDASPQTEIQHSLHA
jgi:deoxyribonuclease V